MKGNMSRLEVVYGNFPGTDGRFTRDPAGFLIIEAGIFQKKGLVVSFRLVQGTKDRHKEIERGTANISLVNGRAALKHFLDFGWTRLLGCSINSCPYRLVVQKDVRTIGSLRGKSLACRGSTVRSSSLAQVLQEKANLNLGKDIWLKVPPTDEDAFDMLFSDEVQAALLPQPLTIIAEERGLKRITDWPDVVDDPLPLLLETTESQFREKRGIFIAFIDAYREGIRYLKNHRDETMRMLSSTFGQSAQIAAKAFDDYFVCLNDSLTVSMKKLNELMMVVAPNRSGEAQKLASEWVIPGSLAIE